ncbi:hypothetical protein, partial [Escherichia coli]|uniref:hypothetical protein n=1 Tax=Escherichia coli TaxID=562 RepID=UPI001A7E375F
TRGDLFYLNSLRRGFFFWDDKNTSQSQEKGMGRHSTELLKRRKTKTATTTRGYGGREHKHKETKIEMKK